MCVCPDGVSVHRNWTRLERARRLRRLYAPICNLCHSTSSLRQRAIPANSSWLMNFLASLRVSTTRRVANSPLRTLPIPQHRHASALAKTRHYLPDALHSFPPRFHVPRVLLDSSSDDPSSSSGASAPPSSSSSSSGDDPDGSDPPASPPPDSAAPVTPSTSISRQSVPENYPQVLALPIARRPLFPGFYKAVVIRNPQVVAAVKEMMKRGQPYLGAFLLKDEQADSDVITDVDSVHPVGVFAQITSVFAATSVTGKEDDKEEGLTAVLYPHRRIKITDLVKAGGSQPSTAQVEPVESSVPPNQEQLPTPPPSPEAAEAELPVDQVTRHPSVSNLTVSSLLAHKFFSASTDLLPPGL